MTTEEVRHLSQLLDDLQEIAIAEARQLKLRISSVSLAEVARSAARAAGLEHDPRLRLDIDAVFWFARMPGAHDRCLSIS